MGRPGYYLSNPAAVVTFPRAPRPGSGHHKWMDTDLVHETEEGVLWVYPQIRRRIWSPVFRVSQTDLSVFETLHLAVNGMETPFYWVPDVSVIATAYLVRKEAGFDPQELEEMGTGGPGQNLAYFDYTLILTEEISGTTIDT